MSDRTVGSGIVSSGIMLGSGDTLLVLGGGRVAGTIVSSGGTDTVEGTASGTVLLAFGTEIVSSGGLAAGTSVGSGATQQIFNGGEGSGTIVGSGGEAFVLSGGLMEAASVQSGGFLSVSAGGLARDTVLSAGATELLMSGAVASATLVAGGAELVSSGGTAVGSVISGGGTETVLAGGTSLRAVVSGGGFLVVSSGGVASGATVSSGGFSLVSGGGIASGTMLASGGTETVLAGGVTIGTGIGAGGLQVVSSGGVSVQATIGSGGYQFVSAGGLASGTVIGFAGEGYVLSNGVSQDALVGSGGLLTVSSGGAALATQVGNGGALVLQSGGIASGGLIRSGGRETVLSGAETIGDAIGAGGFLVLSAGGVGSDISVGAGGFLVISSGAAASGATVSSGGMEVISAGGQALATTLLAGGSIDLDSLGFAAGGSVSLDSASGLLTVSEAGATATVQLAGSFQGLYFHLSADADGSTIVTADGTPCFCPGTLIRTETGDVPVERLRIGDMLVTAGGASRPLRWIGRRSYDGRFAANKPDILPVMIRAGALADGVPRRDLFVSPLHAMFLDGCLVPAMLLVNGVSIVQATAIDTVEYIHLELDSHDILLSEDAPSESFIDDNSRGMFHNAAEFAALYPDAVPSPARFCAPRLDSGDELEALRARLARRAGPAILLNQAATPLDGQLDEAGCGLIRGWARDHDGAPVRVRILVDGRTIAVQDANLFRPDLEAVGIGDGCHGFEFVVPGGLDPKRRHVIQVQRMLGGGELHGSPVFLDMAADAGAASSPVSPARDAEPAGSDGCHGHVDRWDRGLVKGWAWNSADPDQPVAVQLFAGGHLLARAVANIHRPDLAAAGIGTGRHGFEIALPAELSLLERHVLHLRIEQNNRALLGSPVVIEAAGAFDGRLERLVSDAVAGLGGAADRERVLLFLLEQAGQLRQRITDDAAGRRQREEAGRLRRIMGPLASDAEPVRRALVIDERMPAADRDAGSQALLSHIEALQALGYEVSFASNAMEAQDGPQARALCRRGVRVCGAPVHSSVEDVLRRQANCFDVVYMHRVSIASAYMALARRSMPAARLLFSVADLHHLRLGRQAQVERRPDLLGLSHRIRLEECTAAWQAHAVLTHSSVEADLLRREVPAARVYEVPWAVSPARDTGPSFASRRGIAFVGHYGHQPNEDAACWLVETVMKLVWARDPGITCLLAGSDITPRIHALGRPGVEIHGHLPDLSPLWRRVRLSVAPLRFGAGIKGKVLNSLAAGVPCVMTPVAAEGLGLCDTLAGLVAEDAEALADRILRLHEDEALHDAACEAGLALVRERHDPGTVREALRLAIEMRPAGAVSPVVAIGAG